MFTKNIGSKTKEGQIKFDINLAKEHGVEAAIVIGILYDPTFMLDVGKKKRSIFGSEYTWDIVGEDGRAWIGLDVIEFEILFPFWKTDYTREVFNRLVEKKIFDTTKGNGGMTDYYSLNQTIKPYIVSRYKK